MLSALLLVATIAVDTPTVRVEIDSAHHQVTVVAGPFLMPAMPEMLHGGHDMRGHYTPLYRWEWPVEGWIRGFNVELYDSLGKPLNRRLLHHITVLNFDRRQLIRPYVERLFAFGSETKSVMVPKTVGIPMTPGFRMGIYMAWNNTSTTDINGAYLHLKLYWMPKNMTPAPTSVIPLVFEVKGYSGAYDIPPGVSSKSYEFTLPVSGRILGAGGHMHDFAKYLELVDVDAKKTVLHLDAHEDSTGQIHGVERTLPGIYGRGIRLTAGRKYRVTAVYDNTTGEKRVKGAMGAIGTAFVPDDMAKWPAVDPADTMWVADVQWMEDLRAKWGARTTTMEGMEGMNMGGQDSTHSH
jgi:hypothetical protein